MQIRWKEGDIAGLETHPLTPGLGPAGVITVQPTPTTTTPDPDITTTGGAEPESSESKITGKIEPTESSTTLRRTDQSSRTPTTVTTPTSSGDSLTIVTVTTSSSRTSLSDVLGTTTTDDNPTSTPDTLGPQSSNSGRGIMNNPTALAIVFLSSLFVGLGLIAVAYVMFRRHRNKAVGQRPQPSELGVGVWVQRSSERMQTATELQGSLPAWPMSRTQAELGTDGPTPELGVSDTFGTRDNPAELDGGEMVSRHRWSWLSHVPTTLSVRPKKSAPPPTPSRHWATPHRTLSEASDSSTSTVGSVNSEKALLPPSRSR